MLQRVMRDQMATIPFSNAIDLSTKQEILL